MKHLISQLTETTEFRNHIVTSLQDFEKRFKRMNDHFTNGQENERMNYNAAQIKIKTLDKKFLEVVSAFDSLGDIYQRDEILCGQLLKSNIKELPTALTDELSENYKKIMHAKPSVEKLITELLSLLADAEKELYQPKQHLIRR